MLSSGHRSFGSGCEGAAPDFAGCSVGGRANRSDLHRDRGEFEERNSVLKDILESLQEIGFFVQAPEYVNPDRPDQAVIIRANRADQTMVARVGLNSEIESDWQGVHGEYCTDAFLDYVRQMNLRGVEITSQSPQLFPTLKQKNSLTLPSANDSRSGIE